MKERLKKMAHFLHSDAYRFEEHPKFHRVRLAKLAGNDQQSPAGISMLELEPGAEVPVHTHENSIDSIFVMSGNAEIYHDGQWHHASEGDYCFVPAGEEHGVKNQSEQILRLFIVHSPPLF